MSFKINQTNHQQGVALLTVMLMVMVASILATVMLAKQQKIIKETNVLTRQDTLQSLALAGEKRALALLNEDAKNNKTDSTKDIWAQNIADITVPNGKVSIKVKDFSGRYNINNLHYGGAIAEEQKKYFERLLGQVGLPKELAEAVIDWQDNDNKTTGKQGAEADYYASENIIPANQDFYSTDELWQVKGFTANAMQALKPYIVAIPVYTKVNVNTAKMPVLSALAEDLDTSQVLDFVESRENSAVLDSAESLYNEAAFSQIKAEQKDAVKPLLAVESDVFLIQCQVTLDGKESFLSSWVFKHKGIATVFQRDFSTINWQAES